MKIVSFCKKPGIIRNATLLCLLTGTSAAMAETPAGYYDSINNASPLALRSSLHEIIDDHQRYPYTSSATDTWDILESADEDPANPANIIDIYRNASYTKEGGGNSFYNREHTWPKSFGFPNDGSANYPYTDTHHLFLSDSGYNSSRSNKPYANCESGCSAKTTVANNNRGGGAGDSNWTGGSNADGSWQTWAGRKGDTARALMYMAVRYEGGTHGVTGVSEPDLILTDDRSLIGSSNQGSNIDIAYMGLKSVLLQWHKEDPVDAFEQRHNDTVYLYQGNRNPFIDHPEYVACVFENVCGGSTGDTTAPSAPDSISATGGAGKADLSWAANSESDLAGYNMYRGTTSGTLSNKVNASLLTGTTFTDNSVADDTTYYYAVKAVDTSYNESTASLEATATTDAGSEPPTPPTGDANVWINEVHYDNASTDTGEAVEVAGTAGTDLTGWTLIGYNGNGGTTYKTVSLSGVIADQNNGMGTMSAAFSGMQNGGPDGIALVDNNGAVVQFISYEGSFAATNGPASGQNSTDIGVAETSSTLTGHSLQLSGTGSNYSDFAWQSPAASTFGSVNEDQTFGGVTPPPVNEAPTAAFTSNCYAMACTFDASTSTDTDGTIANYDWDFGDGNTSTDADATHSYASEGEYNVVLTITDNEGATDTTTAMVTVAPLKDQPWVNEFHYDNSSSDKNEAVEIAGAVGTDLSGWSIVAYNGRNGTHYKTVNLSGVIADQQGGFGTLNFAVSSLQNGAPDGFALVDNGGHVVQFLSYEGTFEATSGVASGMTSTDVGVRETSSTPVGHSLQLGGEGTQYSDFTWQSVSANTAGKVNNNQTLGYPNEAPVAMFTQACKGLNCAFDASGSTDAEGIISAYEWNFGDGTTAAGTNPAYRFSDIGEYTVTLTVTDEVGATAQTSMVMTVIEQRHFENATVTDIEDHGTIASDITVDRTIDASTVDINVDITHEHRGNIDLVAVAPDGSEYVLKKHKRKDGVQDINATYTVDFTGSPVGTWSLVIKDQYWNEVGQLNSWSVQF
jgi:endonuclease I/PKD repeat protein